jgi:prolyl oligopeptidase
VADVVENRYGITTHDPYRWMEGNDNAETKDFLRAQSAYTSAWLARIPAREKLLQRVRELGLTASGSYGVYLAGGRMFYSSIGAGEQLPKLMVRDADGRERVLVDPAALGQGGSHASVNAVSPSPDGALVAYNLALGGGEVSSIHIMDVAAGTDLSDAVDRVWGQFAAGWLPDRSGFFYTQMAPAAKDADPLQNMVVRLHLLGQPAASDATIIGRRAGEAVALAPEEFPVLRVDPESGWVIGTAGGAHLDHRVFIAPLASVDRSGAGKTPWRKVADYADSVDTAWAHGDRLYMSTFKDASNRKMISVPLADPDLAAARVDVAENPNASIVTFAVAHDALYMQTNVNGLARLLRMPWGGAPEPVALPYDGWINAISTDTRRDGAVIDLDSWTRPSTIYRYDLAQHAFAPTGLGFRSSANFSSIAADEVEATSSDGTKVPLSILSRKDLARDGAHPSIVYGYAGYGFSVTPSFEPTLLAWLERGGVYAVCHARGGGEKGHAWQMAGTHENKMNGIHDFEACAQYLIDQRFTSPKKVVAFGGSMGGVLVGRALTERPELFAAADIGVGAVNPLRMLAASNGANQKSELGDPETEAGYRAIYAMDPYQHVQDGVAYPAVMFDVGLNDRRVAPWMTAKMAARMQRASTSGKPILVRVESDAGHGVGSTRDQQLVETADIFSFFLAETGDPEFRLP